MGGFDSPLARTIWKELQISYENCVKVLHCVNESTLTGSTPLTAIKLAKSLLVREILDPIAESKSELFEHFIEV